MSPIMPARTCARCVEVEANAGGVELAGLIDEVLCQAAAAEGDVALLTTDADLATLGVPHGPPGDVLLLTGQRHTQLLTGGTGGAAKQLLSSTSCQLGVFAVCMAGSRATSFHHVTARRDLHGAHLFQRSLPAWDDDDDVGSTRVHSITLGLRSALIHLCNTKRTAHHQPGRPTPLRCTARHGQLCTHCRCSTHVVE